MRLRLTFRSFVRGASVTVADVSQPSLFEVSVFADHKQTSATLEPDVLSWNMFLLSIIREIPNFETILRDKHTHHFSIKGV